MRWDKVTILGAPVIDPNTLSSEQTLELLKIYEEVKHIQFPSLIEQFKSSFQGRLMIDRGLSKTLGLKEYGEKEILRLHKTIFEELESLRVMMQGD